MEPVLSLQAVSKAFDEHLVVNGVSLELQAGQ